MGGSARANTGTCCFCRSTEWRPSLTARLDVPTSLSADGAIFRVRLRLASISLSFRGKGSALIKNFLSCSRIFSDTPMVGSFLPFPHNPITLFPSLFHRGSVRSAILTFLNSEWRAEPASQAAPFPLRYPALPEAFFDIPIGWRAPQTPIRQGPNSFRQSQQPGASGSAEPFLIDLSHIVSIQFTGQFTVLIDKVVATACLLCRGHVLLRSTPFRKMI